VGEAIDKLSIFAANEFKIPASDVYILEVWVESLSTYFCPANAGAIHHGKPDPL
jgi:hypothetical protein